MIIKMIDGKTIRAPDDAVVSETHGSYYFQKSDAERVGEISKTYFIIPVRNVLYIRVEELTKGFEGAGNLYAVEPKEN